MLPPFVPTAHESLSTARAAPHAGAPTTSTLEPEGAGLAPGGLRTGRWLPGGENPTVTKARLRIAQWKSMQASDRANPLDLSGMGLNADDLCKLIKSEPDAMRQAQSINLSRNPLGKLPEEFIAHTPHLRRLDIAHTELETVPSQIGTWSGLEHLDLESNKLSTLPEEFGDLKNLQRLHASCNELHILPDSIGKLESLKELSLYGNALTELPATVRDLSHLETLDVGKNALLALPREVGTLSKLSELRLDSNLLENLPKEIGNLSKLEILELQDNFLRSLPANIRELPNLKSLVLSGNPLPTAAA